MIVRELGAVVERPVLWNGSCSLCRFYCPKFGTSLRSSSAQHLAHDKLLQDRWPFLVSRSSCRQQLWIALWLRGRGWYKGASTADALAASTVVTGFCAIPTTRATDLPCKVAKEAYVTPDQISVTMAGNSRVPGVSRIRNNSHATPV